MNAKHRKWGYETKAQHIEQKAETLPKSPAKKPYPGYCKKLKGEHSFELADVEVYNHHGYPQGYSGPRFIVALVNYKEYHCTACGKKRIDREEMKLDMPIPVGRIA